MTDPERWISSRARDEGRLIEAALAELPPDAALERTVSRLSGIGVAVGTAGLTMIHASHLSHASVAAKGALAKSSLMGSVAATTPAAVSVVTTAMILKSAAVGFAVGSTLLFGGHYASVSQAPVSESASITRASSLPQRVPPELQPTVAVVSPRSYQLPEAIGSGSSQRGLSVSSARRAPRSPVKDAPVRAHSAAQQTPSAPDVSVPQPTEATSKAQADSVPTVGVPPGGESSEQRMLAREVAAIARARHALMRHDGAAALRELSALDREGGYRALGQEAALLRVEALAQSGQRSAAATLARKILASGVAEAHRGQLLHYATIENQ